MIKKYKIFLLTLLLIYPIYKGIRELLWVNHNSYLLDKKITIKIREDESLFGFQDFDYDKTLTITNSQSNNKMSITFKSIEPNIYFYIDTINSKITLSVVDIFAGKNVYDYSTLELLSEKNCLKENCGGYNISSFSKLGKPYLTYSDNGFHK